MRISSFYGSPGTGKDHFPYRQPHGSGSQAESRKSDYVPAGFRNQWSAPLTQLPHVADSPLLDQTKKIQKFIRIINRELDRRKRLLSEHGVGTIALYREVTEAEPTMVILMDSYESEG